MSAKNKNISEAELEIMKVLWKQSGAVPTQAINKAVEQKQWKRTTVSTLLARLVEKGAVKSEKRGNHYLYTPLISARAYRKTQVKHLIQTLFDGSVQNFAVSLFEGDTLTEEELKELKAVISGGEG